MENWKWIEGHEGYYEVSDKGRVRSYLKQARGCFVTDATPQRIMKPVGSPYLHVRLCRSGAMMQKRIHRLVLETFVGPCPVGMEACHNDDDKANNALSNLRWDTHRVNQVIDGGARGILGSGENNPAAKLSMEDVIEIRRLAVESDLSHEAISHKFNTNRRNVTRIINRKRWAHV